MASLRDRAVSATIWSGIDTLIRNVLSFGLSLILARLLTPEDYGIVGLLAVFLGVAAVFIESGFSVTIIQRQIVTETELSSIFFFNIGVAALACGLLVVASPWIADFYHMPVLKPLTCLLSLSLLLGAFGHVQRALMAKVLNFRIQCLISVIAMVFSGGIGVYMAWHNYGAWSLAVQGVVNTGVASLLLWVLSSWRPRLCFSFAAIRTLLKFGGFLLMSGLLGSLFSRMNTLLIGKFYSARDLGYYSRADNTQQLPAGILATVITRVAFPVFSAAQNDKAFLRSGLKKAIASVMLLNLPIMIGMAVTARPLIQVLLGERWVPCVPYLQILCLGGVIWPVNLLNQEILTAQGHASIFFRLEIVKKIIGVTLLGVACCFGVAAIAWSAVATGLITYAISAHYSDRFIRYNARRQLLDLAPYFGASLVMAACVSGVSYIHFHRPILLLTAQVAIGATSYFAMCAAFRLSAFLDLSLIAGRVRGKVLQSWRGHRPR